ncbi:hypothetical protein J4206_02665 [Candidatus Woesearchaeota archaeon]|nr:hypothetical protein [Candidatus Woesearchaeota archaeon]
MATKIPEAINRKYKNMFVCRRCKARLRAPNMKVIQGKIKCRNCNSKVLRPVRRK